MGHFSGYAGALALAMILLPIVVRTTEESLRLIPDTMREAGFALGLAALAGDTSDPLQGRR